MESRHAQDDFSGGLNTNSRIGLNELQEAINVNLDEFGVLKPAYADTKLKSVASVTCVRVADGYAYYNVGTVLYRMTTAGAGAASLAAIGAGVFYFDKFGQVYIVIASDKPYKVIDGTLRQLGVAAPGSAPTVAKVAQKEKQIEAFEDHTSWTAAFVDKSDDGSTKKEGTNALKLSPTTANVRGEVKKAVSINLNQYASGSEPSGDDDYIVMWVYVNDTTLLTNLWLIFDCNAGDFTTDFYQKIIPLIPELYNTDINEDENQSYAPANAGLNWDQELEDYMEYWEGEIDRYLATTSYGAVAKAILKKALLDQKRAEFATTTTEYTGQISRESGAWTRVKVRKSEFIRHGGTSGKNWSTIAAVKIAVEGTDASLDVNFDDLRLVGGGNLDGDSYMVCWSYVAKFTLPDGSSYEEESAVSSDTEITDVRQQNLSITNLADSADAQVTHKRVYLMGGAVTLRHRIGEIATGVTSLTTDKSELDLVVEPFEDCRRNQVPPTSPTHGMYLDGRLYIAKGNDVYWSRSLIPSAYRDEDYTSFTTAVKALYENGSNLAVLQRAMEEVYMNPGLSAVAGGYLHRPEAPHGCVSTASAAKGFHLADEGIARFRGPDVEIISDRIRSELLGLSGLTAAVGAYHRGKYFLCVPAASAMYEYDSIRNRFLKHTGMTFVAAGDDGILYLVKSDGIYSFETDTTKRKAFSMRTAELVMDNDSSFSKVIVDAEFGSDTTTIEYYVNGAVKTTITKTTSGRQMIEIPIDQVAGNRISVRISCASEVGTSYGIYGVYLK